jgi:hypothetical protein
VNLSVLAGMLSVAGKIVPILNAIITEVGPAIGLLGADGAQLVTDATKTLTDLQVIFDKLKSNVVTAATTTPPTA